tara:strand:+ start:32 stop:967 length:936 start_codon:yes stop_codon:yes gene_type:complete
MWVEFAEPYFLPEDEIPDELIEAVQKREWVEPPGELVRSLRDGLRPHLLPITPNVSSWDEHGAFHLIAQLESRIKKAPLTTWKSEVLAAREVRDRFQTEPEGEDSKPIEIRHPIVDAAKEIHLQLKKRNLDGRDLNASGDNLRIGNPLKGIQFGVKTALMVMLLPAFLISLSPQLILGRFLGDRTDEGVDARTTYQFLAAMFGSVLLWPFFALIGVWIVWVNSSDISTILSLDITALFGDGKNSQLMSMIVLYLAMIPLFWTSGRMFGFWWDGYVDARRAYSRLTAGRQYKHNLEQGLRTLTAELRASDER